MFKRVFVIIALILFFGCGKQGDKYGTITEKAMLYSETGLKTGVYAEQNARVLYFEGKCSKGEYDEPRTKIMLPNVEREFVNGKVGCVVNRKIKWDN